MKSKPYAKLAEKQHNDIVAMYKTVPKKQLAKLLKIPYSTLLYYMKKHQLLTGTERPNINKTVIAEGFFDIDKYYKQTATL